MDQQKPAIGAAKVLRFFATPGMSAIGWVGTMVGLVLSVYFFWASQERPELTYFVHPAKASVARPAQTSRLAVMYEGQPISGDVTAAQVAFWNAGRRAIHSSAILKPLVIRTSNNARIFEARVVKSSRDVVRLRIDQSRAASGEIEVGWNILEQNDGGVIQVIHSGDDSVELQALATVEGQNEVLRLNYSPSGYTPSEDYARRRGWRSSIVALVAVASVFGFLLSSLYLVKRRRILERLTTRRAEVFIWTYAVVMLIVVAMLMFLLRVPAPPFGF